ncbi:unnamed protein product [Durusdinium trenchii]|uniref:Uncharacterized protein n=1 Tax=Durusdinium trenchii TaxID=1381693 RepID=A0ABP0RB50_9DINO
MTRGVALALVLVASLASGEPAPPAPQLRGKDAEPEPVAKVQPELPEKEAAKVGAVAKEPVAERKNEEAPKVAGEVVKEPEKKVTEESGQPEEPKEEVGVVFEELESEDGEDSENSEKSAHRPGRPGRGWGRRRPWHGGVHRRRPWHGGGGGCRRWVNCYNGWYGGVQCSGGRYCTLWR